MVSVIDFHQWNQFHPHIRRMDAGFFVQGKKGNLHKSFDVELDAYIWLQVALLKGTITLLN